MQSINDTYKLLKQNNFIVSISGKDAVKVQGYLLIAQLSFEKLSIKTELIEHDRNDKYALFKAIVETEKGIYIGHGDADKNNTRGAILKAYIRQAETRAIGRALRWALGDKISATALEEFDIEKEQEQNQSQNHEKRKKVIYKPEGPPSINVLQEFKAWTDQYHGFDPMYEFCAKETLLQSYPDEWSNKQIKQFMAQFETGKLDDRYHAFLKKYEVILSDRQFPMDQIYDQELPF
tara:strand:- start:1304 stop:2008 length:705 start_codon:yes stop_codon:yes gene_type:complete